MHKRGTRGYGGSSSTDRDQDQVRWGFPVAQDQKQLDQPTGELGLPNRSEWNHRAAQLMHNMQSRVFEALLHEPEIRRPWYAPWLTVARCPMNCGDGVCSAYKAAMGRIQKSFEVLGIMPDIPKTRREKLRRQAVEAAAWRTEYGNV